MDFEKETKDVRFVTVGLWVAVSEDGMFSVSGDSAMEASVAHFGRHGQKAMIAVHRFALAVETPAVVDHAAIFEEGGR